MKSKTVTLPDGCLFVGTYADGIRQGSGAKTYPNGAMFVGTYVDDVRHGSGYKIHADKSVHRVKYWHGVLQK